MKVTVTTHPIEFTDEEKNLLAYADALWFEAIKNGSQPLFDAMDSVLEAIVNLQLSLDLDSFCADTMLENWKNQLEQVPTDNRANCPPSWVLQNCFLQLMSLDISFYTCAILTEKTEN